MVSKSGEASVSRREVANLQISNCWVVTGVLVVFRILETGLRMTLARNLVVEVMGEVAWECNGGRKSWCCSLNNQDRIEEIHPMMQSNWKRETSLWRWRMNPLKGNHQYRPDCVLLQGRRQSCGGMVLLPPQGCIRTGVAVVPTNETVPKGLLGYHACHLVERTCMPHTGDL